MADHNDKDFVFVMTCMKHAKEKLKPDFEEVAKELGATTATQCYKRLWAINKKWGLAGNSGRGRKPSNGGAVGASPASGRKRRAAAVKKEAAEDDDDHDELGGSDDSACERKEAKMTALVGTKKATREVKAEADDDVDELA